MSADAFKHVAILGGGGLMGHGIALACLQASAARVTLVSRKQESIDLGMELIEKGPFGLEKGVKRGKVTEDQASEIMGRVDGSTDYAKGLAGADLIFESIPEIVDIKQDALCEAEKRQACGEGLRILELAQFMTASEAHGTRVVTEELDAEIRFVFELFDVESICLGEGAPVDMPDIVSGCVELVLTKLDGCTAPRRAMKACE